MTALGFFLFCFFWLSGCGASYCRAEESGLRQERLGAEVDPGQWLIPLESCKSDGMGKREREGEKKEKMSFIKDG